MLAKFAKKKSSEMGCFLLIVSWRSFPLKFPVKSANFSKNLPRKTFKIWLFSAKILRNRPIFPRICPWKSREILRFFPRNIRSPVNGSSTVVRSTGPVVQTLDSPMHRINHYPVGKYYGNQYYTNRIVIYPVDSATQRLNNWGLVIIIGCVAGMGWERSVTGVT